jgi:hypothetical protein
MTTVISHLRSESARNSHRRWNSEEDKVLLNAVGENTRPDWRAISTSVPSRTARQCRERFTNYLSTAPKNAMPWTSDDDKLLLRLSTEFGSNWHRIAAYFPTRSEVAIKNRFQTLIYRRPPPRPPTDLEIVDPDPGIQCFAPKREVRWLVPDNIELLKTQISEGIHESLMPDTI